MKKIFTITLLVLLTVGLFVSCNADAVETVTALTYTLTSDNTLVDSLGREYKSFIVSKTGETYKLIKILSKNEECLIESDEKNIIVRTDGGKVTIYAPNAVVEHFGTADSVIVKKVANDSYHCHAKVSNSLSIEAGHVVLNVAVPSVEIKATSDVSVEIVENIKVEQIKIEEPKSSVETPEIKISGIGEAKNIEINTPVVIDMKVEQVEIKKAVEVEFSDSAEVSNVAVSVDKTEIDNLKITVGDNAKIKGVSVDDEIKEDIKKAFVDNSGQTKEVHQHLFKTELKNKNDKWYEITTCTGDGCTYRLEVETYNAPTSFTVSFNTNDGSTIVSQTVNKGEKATEPTDKPTKDGYAFDGWYSDEALTNEYDFNTLVTKDITLYAKWVKTVTYGCSTDKNTAVPVAAEVIKTQEEFKAASQNFVSGATIYLYLGEGEFNVQETDFKGKNVTIQGSGYDKTIIKYGKTGQTGEYSGCYSFEDANVTFRDVTLSDYNGTKNYTGFIRVHTLNFENCCLKSMMTYAGGSYSDDRGITTFNDCTYENDSDYLMWLYGVDGTYNFTNCLFKSGTGKFFNAYHESNSELTIHINFTSCKFLYTGTSESMKIYGYALLKNNQVYVLTITDCVDNFNDFNLLKDKVTEYSAGNSYSSQYVVAQEAKNGTKVVIDGNTVYEKK